jgi:hypothetical protein
MFKLADPESGRRAIQIWDEKGAKLFTMLLTVPDEQPEPKDDPVVMFSERPSGSAPAVKSWFYPAERRGYEFIYPKDQAMKIAAAANAPVLAYNNEVKSDADEAALRGAQVGRIDAQGRTAADNTAATASTTTASTTSTTTASTTAAQAAASQPSNAEPPSANRTAAPSAAPTTTTASAGRSDAATVTGVGTSGQANPRTAQAPQGGAQPAQRANGELPRTASSLTAMQLLSAGLIVSALGVRQMRRRFSETR